MTVKKLAGILTEMAEQNPNAKVIAANGKGGLIPIEGLSPAVGWFVVHSGTFIPVSDQPLDDHFKINAVCLN